MKLKKFKKLNHSRRIIRHRIGVWRQGRSWLPTRGKDIT